MFQFEFRGGIRDGLLNGHAVRVDEHGNDTVDVAVLLDLTPKHAG